MVIFLILNGKINPLGGLIFLFLTLFIIFLALINLPNFQCKEITINIERDMLQVNRRFLINLQSGSSIFLSYADLAKTNFYSAKYFDEVVSKIYLGMPMEDAIKQSIRLNPSKKFKHMQSQILTALMTGSDLEKVLIIDLEQSVKEYIVLIKEYGRKLSAIAMIYMIFGTILPAIGAVFIVIIASIFLSSLPPLFFLILYLILLFLMGITQFLFINLFKGLKPNIEI
jgi:hypothetical protein